MKWILSAMTLVLAFNVQAADTKIGNVIAVERTIENVYNSCIDQIQKHENHDPDSRFFFCTFDVTHDAGEMIKENQRLLLVRGTACSLDAEVKNSKIIMMFNGTGEKANFASARQCLKTALDEAKNNDSFKVIVYTIE